MGYVRKISIGLDYKSGMTYITGQSVINSEYSIHEILPSPAGGWQIWVESRAGEVLLWKEFSETVPTHIEYNLDF